MDSPAADSALRQRFARVRLLSEELDKLAGDLSERAASVSSKASFLAVAAGVLIAASTSQIWTRLIWFGIGALVLACLGLICAAVALRPGRRPGLVAQRLTDSFLDSTQSALVIEAQIVTMKSDVIARREGSLRIQAAWVWGGYALLVISASSLTVVFAAQLIGGPSGTT